MSFTSSKDNIPFFYIIHGCFFKSPTPSNLLSLRTKTFGYVDIKYSNTSNVVILQSENKNFVCYIGIYTQHTLAILLWSLCFFFFLCVTFILFFPLGTSRKKPFFVCFQVSADLGNCYSTICIFFFSCLDNPYALFIWQGGPKDSFFLPLPAMLFPVVVGFS